MASIPSGDMRRGEPARWPGLSRAFRDRPRAAGTDLHGWGTTTVIPSRSLL